MRLTSLLFVFTLFPVMGARADVVSSRATSAAGRSVALDIDVSGRRGSLDDATIDHWVRSTAQMAGDYCGQFPVDSLRVEVVMRSGSRVGFGQHFGGRRVRVHVGRDATEATLAADHVLLHELLHTAFPSLDRRHRWMREGLSTYLETMVRAQAGLVSEEQVWDRWVNQMPNGLPRWLDRGLDRTHTWGRTYWGGALFWMVVDVDLRRATGGRHTLRSLVRGVVARGGVSLRTWPMERLLRVADAVTGTQVLRNTYRRMALSPRAPDLDALFTRLGVRVDQATGRIQLRERAPDAAIRRAMTER